MDRLMQYDDLEGFQCDDIENSYEHKCPECGEAAEKQDDVNWCPDCNRILRQDDCKHWNCDCEFDKEDEDRPWHRDEGDVWRCTCCDWASDEEPETEPVEIYEWYLITDSWIAGQLKELGQPMLDNDYGTWWGRTCTGQAIALDPTFWTILQDSVTMQEKEVENKE
jgi:hypothetical protein